MPCSDYVVLKATSQGHGTARHGMCELTSAVERRSVGYLPAFGYHAEFHEGYQMQMASVKPKTFGMDEEKLIILVQGHECLYNLQHKDDDNNLVKDYFLSNCAKYKQPMLQYLRFQDSVEFGHEIT